MTIDELIKFVEDCIEYEKKQDISIAADYYYQDGSIDAYEDVLDKLHDMANGL